MLKNLYRRLKGVVFFASALVVAKFTTFVFNLYLANNLPADVFGYISIYQSLIMVCILVFGFSLHSVFIRYYYTVSFDIILRSVRPYFYSSLSLSLISSLVIYFLFYEKYYLLPFIGFFSAILLCFQSVYRCESKATFFMLAVVLKPLMLILLYFCLYYYLQSEKISFIYASLFSSVFCVFVCNYLSVRGSITSQNESIRVFYFVAPLVIVQFSSLLNNYFDRFAIDFYLDKQSVGVYSKAYLFGSIFGMVSDVLLLLWAPYLQKNKIKIKIICDAFCNPALYFITLLIIISVIFYFLNLSEMLKIFIVVFLAFVVRLVYQLFAPMLISYDFTGYVAKITIASSLVTVFLNMLSIPNIGLIGAAYSTFFSFLFISFFVIIKCKYTKWQ